MGTAKTEKSADSSQLSYFELFQYAKWYEIVATIVGVILAIIGGFYTTYCLTQFGEITTALVERTQHPELPTSSLPLLSVFGGGRQLTNATYEESMEALLEDGQAFAVGTVVGFLVCLLLISASVYLTNWSALRQITRIRRLFLKAVLRQDMSWYDTNADFNLASIVSEEMVKLKDGMGEKLSIVANLVGTAILGIVMSFPLGWELTLTCFCIVPISLMASVVTARMQTKISVQEMNAYSRAGTQAEEVLKSVKTVVAYGGEDKEINRYHKLLKPAERFANKRGRYTGIGTGFNWLLTYSVNSIGLAYGTWLVINDLRKPLEERIYHYGSILTITFNIYMATQSITFCVPHGESFSSAKAAASNIFKLIKLDPLIDGLMGKGMSPRNIKGEIIMEDITFKYPARPEVTVLKNFSLHIQPGETVALVGPSGCGKSTVLQLVQRMYDPIIGVVKLDDRDIKTLNLEWLRSTLGVVCQEPVLFRGTIQENIAIGDPNATLQDVRQVADLAYAHEFIVKLPEGYNTVIGERGASLSGGQKQRIAIARALLREPAVLLLDEATSALDPHSERVVQAALDRASHLRTTLVVSHRLSTIVKANRIIYMDHGEIMEQGNYRELMEKQGLFYNLVKFGKDFKENQSIDDIPANEDAPAVTKHSEEPKRLSRRFSTKRHSNLVPDSEWMMKTPRGSVCSMLSARYSNYFREYIQNIEADDDVEKPHQISIWTVLKQNAPEWPYLAIGSIAAAVQGTCFPIFALLLGYAMGVFVLDDPEMVKKEVFFFSEIFFVIAVIAGVAMVVQSTAFTTAGLKMTTRLRLKYFSALIKQEIGYYDDPKNDVGSLCSRLSSDTAEVQGATGLSLGLILQGFVSVLVGLTMGICYNWKLCLVGVAFLPLMLGSTWLEGIIAQKSQLDERTAMEQATSIATEAVVSIKTVQSLGVEKVFIKKFDESIASAVHSVNKTIRWRGMVLGAATLVPTLAYCITAVYGVHLVAKENLPYKVLILVDEAVMYGAYMLGQSLVFAPNFTSAKNCAARILSLINRVPAVTTKENVVDKKDWSAKGSVTFNKVDFHYPSRPEQIVLKGIDLKVEPGKTIALVGSSGCGKSTVLQMLQRFYDPDSGIIEIDDCNIRTDLTLPGLRRQLGVVQQEPVLFNRSIAENIAYGDNSRKVTTAEIVAAAKAANIHGFIVSLPQGYDTSLGSGGAQLSGGQKQRVCIARALLRSPRLLLLDEATSALDANSEKSVSEALDAAAKGRTCISIAHRLSTIRNSDVICVIEKGQIVERGTHAELMELQGHYWNLSKNHQTQ